ncbi:LysR family transcriptional regulator [Paraburkholderia sp. ZP32-5]|uniref:LysR family transcriptional regulator n=1 Tax=Paraburkholderia sp. ZP32-5 TaxID=2883245 RepID=UPI001F301315|nr:LysR family transcriptional regulator [Paraburkholderia sp. ZP32-5]
MHGTALRYFLAVAQTGSLSGASGEIHVTISAISRKISALEAEVGTQLFERASHGMRLTPAGQLLQAHARRTVLESEAVLNQIAALRGPCLNEIRIAASESLAQIFLPEAMAEFRRHHKQTRFIMYVVRPSEAARRIADGEVDIAVNFTVEHARGVAVRHSWRSPVYAVMSSTHPLADRMSFFSQPVSDALVARLIQNAEFQSRNLQIQTLSERNLPPHVRAFIDLLKTRIDEADALTGT